MVLDPFRLDELLSVELDPVPGDGCEVWLEPAVGLFDESVPDEPSVALPVADVPHGSPFGPIRPAVPGFDCVLPSMPGLVELLVEELDGALGLLELPALSELGFDVLGLIALGFEALGWGLPGVVVVLSELAPPIEPDPAAPELAPAEPPPALPPPAPPPD